MTCADFWGGPGVCLSQMCEIWIPFHPYYSSNLCAGLAPESCGPCKEQSMQSQWNVPGPLTVDEVETRTPPGLRPVPAEVFRVVNNLIRRSWAGEAKVFLSDVMADVPPEHQPLISVYLDRIPAHYLRLGWAVTVDHPAGEEPSFFTFRRKP